LISEIFDKSRSVSAVNIPPLAGTAGPATSTATGSGCFGGAAAGSGAFAFGAPFGHQFAV